jgi:hypothetical protein
MRSNELPAIPSLGKSRKFHAVSCQQRFVGRHDRFSGRQSRFNRTFSRLPRTPDQLDENINARIACERRRLGDPFHFLEIHTATLVARSRTDRDNIDRAPTARRQRFALVPDLGK